MSNFPLPFEKQVSNINARFKHLMHQLGANNVRGTERHELEVDFAHVLNEITYAPFYIIQKRIDEAWSIVDRANKAVQRSGKKEEKD